MSLRLLPAFVVDNDEDDDGNFTKWMSSYWGHGAEATHSRERKRSFRRPAKTQVDRRASLPTVSQLDAMKLNRLHAATMAPSPSQVRTREEKGADVRSHQRAHRSNSDDNVRPKSTLSESRIATIPELTESFDRKLRLRNKNAISMNNDEKLGLICHKDIRRNSGGAQELHCMHQFHKEAARRLAQGHPHGSSESLCSQLSRRKSADGTDSKGEQQQQPNIPRRQLSLRRHR